MKKVILLAVFIALSGIAYFAHSRQKSQELLKMKRIFKLKESTVFKWEVHYDNIHLICEKLEISATKENSCQIHYIAIDKNFSPSKPYSVTSSSFLANVKNFNTLDYLSTLGSTNEEGEWGINRSHFYTVFYRDKKGREKSKTLYRGNKTIAPKGYYVAASDSEKIYSVEEWAVKALEKKLEEIRVKDFLKIDPEDISVVNIGNWLYIERIGVYWSVNGKPPNEVDMTHVDALVQDIGFLKAEKVFATNIIFDDLREKITIIYKHKKEGSNQTTAFYLSGKKEKAYAVIPGQEETYELMPTFLSIITNPPSHYYSN